MSETTKYLDRVRKLTDTGTDYAVAKLLGLSENSINQYRKGTRTFDDAAALRVARALAIEVAEVIAARNVDRAKTKEEKEEWSLELKHYATRAALVAICAANIWGVSGGVTGNPDGIANSDCGITPTDGIKTLYKLYALRAILRAVKVTVRNSLQAIQRQRARSLRSRPRILAAAT